jgi:glycosyltransferase involved in cell wall biosynthesis
VRIGIDAMLLWGEWTGIGRSIWEVAKRLSSDGRGHEYLLYASRGFRSKKELASPQFRVRRTWFHARNRTLRILWEQFRLPFRMLPDAIEVLHAPAYVMPTMASNYVPVVVTVHDTIAFRRPDLVRRASVSHMKRFLPKTLDRAELVLVPSRTVARDLEELFGSLEGGQGARRERSSLAERIRLVPFGVGPEFRPLDGEAREEARRRLADELGIGKPYVLFVGRIEPKKNLDTVLKAYFAAVMAKQLPHELVLVGPGVGSRRVAKLVRNLGIEGKTHRLGYVADEDLPRLYAAADCLLFPSFMEGFGFPLLEAMACGTPCITSDDPALKELGGGAAVRVAAKRLDLLRLAIERLLTKKKHAEELRAKGIERAKLFTWERTVELTVAAYEEARERYVKSQLG